MRHRRILIGLFIYLAILSLMPGGFTAVRAHVPPPSPEPAATPAPLLAPPMGGARLIRSDEDAIIFEVAVPPLIIQPMMVAGETYQRLAIAGYGLTGAPGEPALPSRGFTLGVPPGAEVTLSLLEADSSEQSLAQVLPVQSIHIQPSLTGGPLDYTTETVPDAAAYTRDAFTPEAPVAVMPASWLRDQRIVQVTIRPVQYNPARGQARVYHRLVVQLTFTYPNGRPVLEARPESADYERFLRATLLNYESARPWRTQAQGPAMPTLPSCLWPAFDNSPVYKVAVNRDGVYQLSYEALKAAGVPVDTINPHTFTLCNAGAPVALLEQGNGDTVFQPGEKLVFYGRKATTRFTDTNIYWLGWDATNPLRMQVINATPAGATIPAYYTTTVHLEQNLVYYSYIPPRDSGQPPYSTHDHWFWNLIGYGYDPSHIPPTRTYTVTLSNLAAGNYTPMLRFSLWGGGSTWQYDAKVYFNGNLVAESANWSGYGQWTGQFPLDANWLINGPNIIKIEVFPTTTPLYTVVADWFEVTYRRGFVAQNDQLTFGYPGGTQHYQVSGLSSSYLSAFDVTNPPLPKYISTTATVAPCAQMLYLPAALRSSGQGPGNAPVSQGPDATFDFQTTTTGPVTYTIQTAAQCGMPGITLDSPSSLHATTNRADYIVIAPASLSAGGVLTPLINLRQSQGMAVTVVDLQDVYDEFSDGQVNPQAIHDFLWYAYQNWTPPAPSYVLLVGDGHYDFKNYLGLNTPNPMPPYLVNIDPWEGEAPADNRYVSNPASYLESALPFMHIGRLPANTSSDVSVMVNKIVNYEANPPATWHHQMVFVSDNGLGNWPPQYNCNQDPAANFFASSDQIITDILAYQPQQPLDRIYFDPDSDPSHPNGCYGMTPRYSTPQQVSTTLISEINLGRVFVNYYGHGAVQYWAAEGLLDLNSVATLANGDRLPVMLPMTCLEGYFVLPQSNFQSVDETMLRKQGGGSVASFAPTGLEVDTGHTYLNAGFYNALFGDPPMPQVGSLADAGKAYLAANTSAYLELIDTFTVLGDPATRVQMMFGP